MAGSPTMIDTIRTCPLKAHYRYVERVPERAKAGALVLGIAVDVAAKHIVHPQQAGQVRSFGRTVLKLLTNRVFGGWRVLRVGSGNSGKYRLAATDPTSGTGVAA